MCTLITALAATHDAGRVQFYCLDFGGGVLATIRDLPHVGAVAGRSEPELVRRMVAELESVLRSRESSACEQDGSCDRPPTCSWWSTAGQRCAMNSANWRSRSPRWRRTAFHSGFT
ncbi:ESX-1 secretion system protein EccCb1 [Mycobacterium kansasii]|uniref:ESX-1 secretion system protein EccCb1 n=1 Tax=Mycobacterium kansasii TaxID=1768 RepID=A0A1V3WKT9_MYCKA|nr:ESX-1 secretion system protein EccCb1 [Mycobacterium kansasii]